MNRNGVVGSDVGAGARATRGQWLIYGTIICVVLLVGVTLAVSANATLLLDRSVTLAVQSWHPAFWTALMVAISWIGYTPQTYVVYVAWLIVVSLLWGKRAFIEGAIGLTGNSVTGRILGILVPRTRPGGSGIFVVERGAEGNTLSFPAGHVEAFTLVGLLTLWFISQTVRDRVLSLVLRVIIIILMILMGVSRLYLGEHWFTDNLAGYLVGFLWAFIPIYISVRWLSRKMAYQPLKI